MTHTTNAFSAWMLATYEHNELADICNHGCASCAPAGMIYYSETIALFDKYRDDMFDMMEEYQESTGDFEKLPAYVRTNGDNFATFANAVVWFCAELVAMYATDGAYIDETEEA